MADNRHLAKPLDLDQLCRQGFQGDVLVGETLYYHQLVVIAKFFDTVDHDKLMTIIGRTIKDGDVISVVRKFLVSGVMIDDEYEDTIVGTPQGSLCLSNHNGPYEDINFMPR